MSRMLRFVVAALLLVPLPAFAQTVAQSFDELRHLLRTGRSLIVTDEAARVTEGRVVEISSDSFVIETNNSGREPDRKTFGRGTLTAYAERDGLGNGIAWGAIGGLGATVVATAACVGCESELVFGFTALIAIPAGVGGGALVDWLHRPPLHVTYMPVPAAHSVRVAPLIGHATRGIAVSVRW